MAFIPPAILVQRAPSGHYCSTFTGPRIQSKRFDFKSRRRLASLRCVHATIPTQEHNAPGQRDGPDTITSEPLTRGEIIRQVLKFASPSRGLLLLAFVAAFFSSIGNLLVPLVFGRVLDIISSASTTGSSTSLSSAASRLMKANWLLIFTYVGSAVLNFTEVTLMRIAAEKIAISIRTRVFSSLVRADIATLDASPVSDFVSRLSTDTAVLQRVIADDVAKVIQGFTELVVALGVLFWLSTSLALITAISIPITVITASIYGSRTAPLARSFSNATANASATASEVLTGIRTVKAFTREAYAEERYSMRLRDALYFAIRSAWADGFLRAWNKVAFGMNSVIVFQFGGMLVMKGFMTIGSVLSSILYASNVSAGLTKLSTGTGELIRSSGSIDRILRIVRTIPIVERPRENSAATEVQSAMKGSIEFRDVWFQYPASERVVLKNVNLKIPAGGNVAFVGKSGGGKSTTTSLLARFYDPVRGQVIVGGEDLRTQDLRYVRECVIGLVDQEPFLVSGTLADNIRFGRDDASDAEIEDAARAAGVLEFSKRFPDGLDSMIQKLSGGERQRVMIARCLIKRPKIIILDESTSALDAKSEALVSETIEALMKDGGITVILVSHRLSAVKYCDQIYVFSDGEIVERGIHDELVSRDSEYAKLFKVAD